MEHKVSLQCSQDAANGPSLGLDESSPHAHTTTSLRSIKISLFRNFIYLDFVIFCTSKKLGKLTKATYFKIGHSIKSSFLLLATFTFLSEGKSV
jgi:hypothetical protein